MKNKTTIILASSCLLSVIGTTAPGQPAAKILTLDQCIERALEQSPDLTKAKATRTMGSASLQGAAAPLLPHLSASSSYGQSGPAGMGYDASGRPVAGQNGHSDSYRSGINVSQSVVNLSSWAKLKGSINEYQASSASYNQSVASLVFQVKDAYYNLAKLTKALEVAKASVEQSQEQAKQARAMYQLGSMSRSDMLKIEVRLTQNKVALLAAQKGLIAGKQALRGLVSIGEEFGIESQLAFPDTTRPVMARDSLYTMAAKNNPGLRAAREQSQAAKDNYWAAWLAKLPSLNASYSYGYSDTMQFVDKRSWNSHDSWSASLSLSWNIFDGTASEAAVRQAYAQKRMAEADYALAQQGLASQVDQAYIEWQAGREELTLVGDLLQQADEDYRLTSEKHRLGAASALDLLTSQVTFNQAQQEVTNALCNYYLALAKVDQLLGRW